MTSIDEAQHRNDWIEWRKHILLEQERLSKDFKEMDIKLEKIWEAINLMKTEFITIKVKAGMWGALSAAATAIVAALIMFLK